MSDAAAAAASAAIPKVSAKVVDTPATSVEMLMKESIGTLHKATVASNGDLKEDLIDKAPILIDKAEVMQVISSSDCFDFSFSFEWYKNTVCFLNLKLT